MTPAEAAMFGWAAVVPLVGFVMALAVYLLGLSILRSVGR